MRYLELRSNAVAYYASLRPIPVVVLTTSKADADIAKVYDLGANSFLSKPVQFDALVNGLEVVHKKPDPEIFLVAISRLGVAPSQVLRSMI